MKRLQETANLVLEFLVVDSYPILSNTNGLKTLVEHRKYEEWLKSKTLISSWNLRIKHVLICTSNLCYVYGTKIEYSFVCKSKEMVRKRFFVSLSCSLLLK